MKLQVWPHIAALGFRIRVSVTTSIVAIAVLASDPDRFYVVSQSDLTDDSYRKNLSHKDTGAVRNVFVTSMTTTLLVSGIVGTIFSLWFIYLFLKLKNYLTEVKNGALIPTYDTEVEHQVAPPAYGKA